MDMVAMDTAVGHGLGHDRRHEADGFKKPVINLTSQRQAD